MTDENSPQGAGDKDQDLDMERIVAEAAAPGDVRVGGSEPVPGEPPLTGDLSVDDAEAVPGGPPPTGDPRVDDAVAGLRRLPGRPATEHVAILEEVHGRLRDILDDLGPGQS
jgi:hypothetical protein